ncbi:MAG: hypothetical protein O7J95_21955 [Planctomycetota bacterium]|nr:hypothetical protein [Planctomycetota bacterium]
MDPSRFDSLEEALEKGGAPQALDLLAETLREEKQFPQLFEALLMKTRHELGLPLSGNESLRDLPNELRDQVEERYVETCRSVGSLFLGEGDIPGAWPYFRAIDEPRLVAEALEEWKPRDDGDDGDDDGDGRSDDPDGDGDDTPDCDAIIDIAFHQGANPERGFELILSEYGTCRAITTFEHQFPYAAGVREACGQKLVRRLYRELLEGLQCDLERRGEEVPEDASVRSLVEGRSWLFEEHGYHVDMSHLQSVVRAAATLRDEEVIGLAVHMCEYGRNLARDLQTADQAPFDDFYNDYRIFLRALTGEGVDGAARFFTAKAERHGLDESGNHFPGEVLVHLLDRTGRHEQAIEAYLKYLKDVAGPLQISPTLLELCERSGTYQSLLDVSRAKDDLLQYAAALVKRREADGGGSEGD